MAARGKQWSGCTNYGRLPGPDPKFGCTLYRLVSECTPTLASWIPYKGEPEGHFFSVPLL
eukprot:scaffold22320_cov24-Cyclotella_meneghiniana.AAC.3